jgi:hypothetical protein
MAGLVYDFGGRGGDRCDDVSRATAKRLDGEGPGEFILAARKFLSWRQLRNHDQLERMGEEPGEMSDDWIDHRANISSQACGAQPTIFPVQVSRLVEGLETEDGGIARGGYRREAVRWRKRLEVEPGEVAGEELPPRRNDPILRFDTRHFDLPLSGVVIVPLPNLFAVAKDEEDGDPLMDEGERSQADVGLKPRGTSRLDHVGVEMDEVQVPQRVAHLPEVRVLGQSFVGHPSSC